MGRQRKLEITTVRFGGLRDLGALMFLFAVVAAGAVEYEYVPTPMGYVLKHCVHEVPNEAHILALEDGSTRVVHPDGTSRTIPRCDTRNGTYPTMRSTAQVKGPPLPANYDGWLQYTAINITASGAPDASTGFDAFTNVMSVPDVPRRPAQVLYFFPGLQNIDWIPKVDPEPSDDIDFDIIQPVLQYPGTSLSGGWELKSWYVTLNAGALYSSGLSGIQPGDAILCNMTRTGPSSWVIIGSLKSDPSKKQTQKASNSRLALQPWAYNTLECYGCSGCETYPTQPITFTDNKLFQNGVLLPVNGSEWKSNPKPAKKLMCKESTAIAENGDTTISFA